MLKHYMYNGCEWQYEEGNQPAGAVEIVRKKAVEPPANKAKKPVNKARKAVRKK